MKVQLLRGDNITPRKRTPWAGTRIASKYKVDAALPSHIGEAWEVSVEPDFPSRLESGESLETVITEAPDAWLGDHARAHGGLGLLVKLLDASMSLSVQIHPRDDDPALGASESGKPESWYILDADDGAGIYLGLAPGVDETKMRETLDADGDVAALLNFVPCAPGDFFVLPPGTPHAIGAGLTLVEPQRVLPGRRGLTYRYWDHGRRYDDEGVLDDSGSPRELHVERALAVTDWSAPRGEACVSALRMRAGVANLTGPAKREVLCGPGGLHMPSLGVERVSGTGSLNLGAAGRFRSLTLTAGEAEVDGVQLRCGRSLVIPACISDADLGLDAAVGLIAYLP